MKTVSLLLIALSLLAGCAKQPPHEEQIARTYFDRVLRGDAVPYRIGGVLGYTIRNYEIANVSSGLVVVKVTYASQAGTDLVKTKRYAITGDKLAPLDLEDIDQGVRYNLACVIMWAAGGKDRSWEAKIENDHVKFSAIADHEVALRGLHAQAGEDYRSVMLTTKRYEITGGAITMRDGRTISLEAFEAAQVSLQ